jgi:hypothetical protein
LPALMALIVVGLLAEERRHRAAPYLLWAAAILAVSITLRSLDFALCDRILMQGRKVGTHFAWHLLNGLALFLLLRASLEGAPDRLRAPRRVSAAEETAAPEAVAEPPEAGELRPFTAIEMTLAKGLVPPGKPKKLAERVASASQEAAKEGDAAKEAEPVKTGTEPEVLSSA